MNEQTILFAQALVNGIMIGGVFALLAVGLTLIWGVMRIINFAHGEFLMVAMYASYFLVVRAGMDPYLTVLITIPFLFLVGVLVFQTIINPVLKAPAMNQILLTVGLSLIMQNLAQVFLSADVLFAQTTYSRLNFNLGPVVLGLPNLVAFGGSILAAAILYWFLQKTDTGRAIRAASQNREAATLMGINVQRTFLLAFGIGSACLGAAAPLMIPFYYVSPTVGNFFGLIAFVVVVLGGTGNFLGALVAGLIIGLAESLGAALMPGSLSRFFTFGIFILALLFKPEGIFGGKKT